MHVLKLLNNVQSEPKLNSYLNIKLIPNQRVFNFTILFNKNVKQIFMLFSLPYPPPKGEGKALSQSLQIGELKLDKVVVFYLRIAIINISFK